METIQLLNQFYSSFQKGNYMGMNACYADNIRFEDPAFGVLEGDRARSIWNMLLLKGQSTITYDIVESTLTSGKVNWTASYKYGPHKRPVINHVNATFEISNGLIISHQDKFDLWQWSRQALGMSGLFLGWSNFMKDKIQQKTNRMLDAFMANETN